MKYNFDSIFPRYTKYNPSVPVWCVTPDTSRTIHRFFDTSPVSPSGRYMALTRLPYEDRLPQAGDAAEIVLVDLTTGECNAIASTRGWDTQLGAQVQWGKDDSQLFFNDMDTKTWRPFGVRMNPVSGGIKKLEGTIYMVSRDGRFSLSPCLMRMSLTQAGYGVIVPPEHIPASRDISSDDGIYITDNETGKKSLLISIKEIVETAEPKIDMKKYGRGTFYGFHVKWNLQGSRIMFVLRYLTGSGKIPIQLVTVNKDGGEVYVAMPASEWTGKGGHHPNWHPDGEHVTMNLKIRDGIMRFVKVRYDGSNYGAVSENFVGSGHPSVHPNGSFIITDAYNYEKVSFGDGTVPIRMIDLEKCEEKNLVRVKTQPLFNGPKGQLRVDPHPAWDYSFRYVVFNACPEDTRRVYIADLSRVLE